VRVLDHGRTAEHAQYLALELVEGSTLAAALRADGPFEPMRAAAIARGLLAALAHAHGRGVLHRDLKPENVILAPGGAPRIVLIDFGLASLRDAGPLTAAGICVGSPSYIAPERLAGQPYDERSDVYGVGVILYELLAGAPPFRGRTPEEIMAAVQYQPFRPLRALRPDVPALLDAIVRRALARAPARRFADAEEMMSALDELAALERQAAADVLADMLGAAPAVPVTPAAAVAADAADAADAAAADINDAAQTRSLEIAQLEAILPSPWSRFWSWFRFGRWRARLRRLPAAASC
jgi:serine/threonine-protein kinase